jgi:hypothetical protein
MKAKDKLAEIERQKRYFDTTQKVDFVKKDQFQNTIGRRVMLTQDHVPVSLNEKDENFVVEHGTWRRMPKNDDEELQKRIPKGDYHQQQPITYWTHMQDRKHYWMSAAVGSNPFARTSGFTQPADQTKSVACYYGNIDFDQESNRVSFRKTVGNDLGMDNPYLDKEVAITNFSEITKRVIAQCK